LSFIISNEFAEDFDKIERNINIHIRNIQGFIRDNFPFKFPKQYIDTATEDSMKREKK
jgi:hypothetical protein